MLIITYDASLGSFTKYYEKIWSRQKITRLNVLQTINFLFIKKNKTISNQFEIKVRIWEFQFMSQLVSTSMLIQLPAFSVTAWLPELSLSPLHATRAKKDTVLSIETVVLLSQLHFSKTDVISIFETDLMVAGLNCPTGRLNLSRFCFLGWFSSTTLLLGFSVAAYGHSAYVDI